MFYVYQITYRNVNDKHPTIHAYADTTMAHRRCCELIMDVIDTTDNESIEWGMLAAFERGDYPLVLAKWYLIDAQYGTHISFDRIKVWPGDRAIARVLDAATGLTHAAVQLPVLPDGDGETACGLVFALDANAAPAPRFLFDHWTPGDLVKMTARAEAGSCAHPFIGVIAAPATGSVTCLSCAARPDGA